MTVMQQNGKLKAIDISQELFSCKVYPGDMAPTFDRAKTIESDGYNLTNVSMCVHNGTHIDALKHFVSGGKGVHELDLSVCFGKCTVVEFAGIIGEDEIAGVLQICHERLLLKGICELSESGATALANSHVKLIGVESQSVGNADHPAGVHMILLNKEIIPLEGLVLSSVDPGEYFLSAFPINMEGSDGAPVRAVLLDRN
ncbi:MAG: cyclase family protein [Oscillospiraceae bacterium]|nr:cyclase family protein [Oscillospiraceae bacterium]